MSASPDERSPGHLSAASLKWHAVRAFRYGLIGATGLALDFTLFLALVHAGVDAFAANLVSSGTALTFGYCISVRKVFRYHGEFIVPLFATYLFYHLCGTIAVSWV